MSAIEEDWSCYCGEDSCTICNSDSPPVRKSYSGLEDPYMRMGRILLERHYGIYDDRKIEKIIVEEHPRLLVMRKADPEYAEVIDEWLEIYAGGYDYDAADFYFKAKELVDPEETFDKAFNEYIGSVFAECEDYDSAIAEIVKFSNASENIFYLEGGER